MFQFNLDFLLIIFLQGKLSREAGHTGDIFCIINSRYGNVNAKNAGNCPKFYVSVLSVNIKGIMECKVWRIFKNWKQMSCTCVADLTLYEKEVSFFWHFEKCLVYLDVRIYCFVRRDGAPAVTYDVWNFVFVYWNV